MLNVLNLDANKDAFIKFIPNYKFQVWMWYMISFALAVGFLVLNFILFQNEQSFYVNLLSLVRMMFHTGYSFPRRQRLSFIIYNIAVILGFWAFNLFLGMLINTDRISIPRASIYDSLQEYYNSPLQPCWADGSKFITINKHFCELNNIFKIFRRRRFKQI